MGTPDLLGTYGTYQHFAEDGPVKPKDYGGGRRSRLFFENETAKATLIGPMNAMLQKPAASHIRFEVHRDIDANAAIIEIQDNIVLLESGQWSEWIKLDFELSMPAFMPNKNIGGICRFYLQEVKPNFRLYVTPVNTDPSEPVLQITEPGEFIVKIADKLGLFYTTGFQEDHRALSNKVFTDDEYAQQAAMVLAERMNLLDYAMDNYDDGLLFFYFSSTDLQSHMFWWDSDDRHPTRTPEDAKRSFEHLKGIYRKMDGVIADILKRYGNDSTIIVMSDHGFANFKRQFNLNTWLRDNGYMEPADCTAFFPKTSEDAEVDWSKTRAYGLGINGLYLNLKGRERDGIVKPGEEQEALLDELIATLEAVRDTNGRRVIRRVRRTSSRSATALAPDLIVGYSRDYRASWDTCLGNLSKDVLSDNDMAWAADHCADMTEVPGVVFSNRPIAEVNPSLIDLAPSILKEFGLEIPSTMEGKNIF
jgi:hypothetical protein